MPDEVLFEFKRVGAYVKVTALHPATLTEVSLVGPASASQRQLEFEAVRKLNYVLQKNGKPPVR